MKPKFLRKETCRRLRIIAKAILAEPCAYNQAAGGYLDRSPAGKSCGSASCIFGWAVTLFGSTYAKRTMRKGKGTPQLAYELGARALGLPVRYITWHIDRDSPNYRLFTSQNWPEPFQHIADSVLSRTPEAAENAANRIAHFIETDGRE